MPGAFLPFQGQAEFSGLQLVGPDRLPLEFRWEYPTDMATTVLSFLATLVLLPPRQPGLLAALGWWENGFSRENEFEPAGFGWPRNSGHIVHTTSPEHIAHTEHNHSPESVWGLRALETLGGVEWVEWAHEQHTETDKKPHLLRAPPSPENLRGVCVALRTDWQKNGTSVNT